jgi:hypothetical protein
MSFREERIRTDCVCADKSIALLSVELDEGLQRGTSIIATKLTVLRNKVIAIRSGHRSMDDLMISEDGPGRV